jgi:hypothetical protein
MELFMFTQADLHVFINEMLALPIDKRVPRLYAHSEIQYTESSHELYIALYRGLRVVFENGAQVSVSPLLFWYHAALSIYFSEGLCDADILQRLNNREKQDFVLTHWINRAPCRPISPTDFYGEYKRLTDGRLPRALEAYSPVLQAMLMEQDSLSVTYFAMTAKHYIAFHWETTA